MKKFTFLNIVLFVAIIGFSNSCKNSKAQNELVTANQPKKVEFKINGEGQYRLFVENEEFYIKGAGLEFGDIKSLADHGANSFRTWRTNNGQQSGQEVLDEALEHGLMVFMGIEVGRERHGKDYDDVAWVNEQKEAIREEVLMYKDHPALLGWGIGNELNLRYTNKKVWDAVNDISIMIHEIDGNHPTTTMLSGIGTGEVDYIEANCKDLDFLSIQMYGDIINLQQRLEEAGYDGPYMVTEWGATGHWEVGVTEWGAPIEQTSNEKALSIKERYEKAIESDAKRCIGSYVFLWGQKQERTPTWYGLITDNNEETEAIDVMHYFWNDKKWPQNGTPKVKEASLNGMKSTESIHINSGEVVAFLYKASDAEDDTLTWRFSVMGEATDLGDGGDEEERPQIIEGLAVSEALGEVIFNAPEKRGAYRAFIYVLDGNKHAGTANIPFYVD